MPEGSLPRDIVVIEADETFIRDRQAPGGRIEVKSAILYTGGELVSKTAKHKRYRLTEKVTLSTTDGADELAKWATVVGERLFGLTPAKNVLVVGDARTGLRTFSPPGFWVPPTSWTIFTSKRN